MTPEEAKKKVNPFDKTSPNKVEHEGYPAYGEMYDFVFSEGGVTRQYRYIGRWGSDFIIVKEEFKVKEFENSVPVDGSRYLRLKEREIAEINDPKPVNVYEVF